jgi:hypothetical protein
MDDLIYVIDVEWNYGFLSNKLIIFEFVVLKTSRLGF